MKVLVGAAVTAALLVTSAFAQTTPPPAPAAPAAPAPSSCGELPAVPTLPDGATSNRQEMEAANTAYLAWYERYSANIACRRAEAAGLRTQYEALTTEHNTAVETLNATNTRWAAEAEEFNGRGGRRN